MPPFNFPGFYFDQTKNRYFPISQKPKDPLPSPSPPPLVAPSSITPLHQFDLLNPKWPQFNVQSSRHSIQFSRYSSTSKYTHESVPCQRSITHLKTVYFKDNVHQYLGDDTASPGFSEWRFEACPQGNSTISSISAGGSLALATRFGQTSNNILLDLEKPDCAELLSIPGVHDIRSSSLQGQSAVLGAANLAVYIPDVHHFSGLWLETKSDVFSVTQDQNLVYTGLRNGTISRFDVRQGKPLCEKLFPRSGAYVSHVSVLDDCHFFAAWNNGYMATYDLRFTRNSTPLTTFTGCSNSLTRKHNLAIAIDSLGRFVYAAGDDGRVRGWSLRNGRPLIAPSNHRDPSHNLFTHVFSQPPSGLDFQQSTGGDGSSLWITVGKELYRYQLGESSLRGSGVDGGVGHL